MSLENDEIDASFLDSFFFEETNLVEIIDNELNITSDKLEGSIGAFQQRLSGLSKKAKKKENELNVFIERLSLQLYSDFDYLKKDIHSGSTIFGKHDELVKLADKLNGAFVKLIEKHKQYNGEEQSKDSAEAIRTLERLNTVRDNLVESLNTLVEFNNIINKDDNKKIISTVSMKNELNQMVLKKQDLGDEEIRKFAKYKEILKNLDKFYVIYTDFLIELEGDGLEDQIAEMSINQHF